MKNCIDAVEFLKWCNSPMYKLSSEITYRPRVIAQAPLRDEFIIIDENGRSVFDRGVRLSAEEVYNYWVENFKTKE